ncbi:hypothetical protein C8R43DRAFT_867101, partial [Mycena crocata]
GGEMWADCVEKYLNFETACGYLENGGRILGDSRPTEVEEWLREGRKWHAPPKIKNLGGMDVAGTYVGKWWVWWRSVQPPESEWVGGELTCPPVEDMTWERLAKMHGRNGLMQVMATLLWW